MVSDEQDFNDFSDLISELESDFLPSTNSTKEPKYFWNEEEQLNTAIDDINLDKSIFNNVSIAIL